MPETDITTPPSLEGWDIQHGAAHLIAFTV